MTSNQIENRKLAESSRHNREQENIDRDKNKVAQASNRAKDRATALNLVGKLIGAANDPSWYNLDKQLVRDVANLAYGSPLGIGVKIGETSADTTEDTSPAVPGIMRLRFIPTIGRGDHYAQGATSAVNIAARNIYAFVRHANSGSRNYEAADLMMYLLFMDEAYMWYAELTRLYSAALTAKGENRYWGPKMIRALGFDPDSIIQNLAQLRATINQFAVTLNSFYVPNTMPYYRRHFWLVTNFFKDDPIKKSQLYVFVPATYRNWNDAGFISYTTRSGAGVLDFADIVTRSNAIIESLLNSEDIGVMSGDILKAYGNDKLFFVPSIQEDFHIEAVWSAEVLTQIAGAVVVGDLAPLPAVNGTVTTYWGVSQEATNSEILETSFTFDTATLNVVPTPGSSLITRVSTGNGTTLGALLRTAYANHFANLQKDDVSVDDTMVATRLSVIGAITTIALAPIENTGTYLFASVYGTEMVATIDMFSASVESVPTLITSKLIVGSQLSTQTMRYFKFDWAPALLLSPSGNTQAWYMCDIQNYAPISQDVLGKMHSVAVLSEFGVPLLGATVRSR